MKAEMKAVVASLVVIALALTAVSGVTYSWFSDEETAKISVSTANVDYEVSYTPVIKSGDSEINPLDSGKDFAITNLAANAKFEITPNITNKSSIDTIYRIYVTYNLETGSTINNNDLENILVNGTSLKDSNKIVVQSWTPVEAASTEGVSFIAPSFTISTPSTYESTDEYVHSGLTITVVLEAYQSSYAAPVDPSGGSVVIPDSGVISGQVTIEGVSGSDDKAKVVVTFPEDVKGSSFETSVKKTTEESNTYYTITANLDNTSATFSSPVTMTVTLPGNLSGSDVIYVGTDKEQPDVISKDYDSTTDTTTITFKTTHFSDFMVTESEVVAISDDGKTVQTFNSVSAALNAENFTASSIIVASDYEESKEISINKNVTIEGNNHTITTPAATTGKSVHGINIGSDASNVIIQNLTLADSTADSETNLESYGIFSGETNTVDLTLTNVSITGYNAKATYIQGASAVSITGGTYTDNASNINDIVEDAVITGTNAFMGGDHALQIDIKQKHSGVKITIDGVTFEGYNGWISPVCIGQRAEGTNDSVCISDAKITNCHFNGTSGVLGDISVGTTPKVGSGETYTPKPVPAKTANQAFPLEITAYDDTVVCYRGGIASENTVETVDLAPLKLALSDKTVVKSSGNVAGVDSTLNITVTGTATASGTLKANETVTINGEKPVIKNYSVNGTPYETLSGAISEAIKNNGTVTLLDNVYAGGIDVMTPGTVTIDLNGHTLVFLNMDIGFNGCVSNSSSHSAHGDGMGTTIADVSGVHVIIENGNMISGTTGPVSAIWVGEGSSVTLDDVDFDAAAGSGIAPRGNSSEVTVKDSTIYAYVYGIGTNAATTDNYKVKITIDHSIITTSSDNGDNTAVMINVEGNLSIINESVVTGDRQSLIVRAGTATVKDSKIVYTNNCSDATVGTDDTTWRSGNNITRAAIVVGNLDSKAYTADAKLTLDSCTITTTGGKTLVLAQDGENGKSASVTLVNMSDISAFKMDGANSTPVTMESGQTYTLTKTTETTIGTDA